MEHILFLLIPVKFCSCFQILTMQDRHTYTYIVSNNQMYLHSLHNSSEKFTRSLFFFTYIVYILNELEDKFQLGFFHTPPMLQNLRKKSSCHVTLPLQCTSVYIGLNKSILMCCTEGLIIQQASIGCSLGPLMLGALILVYLKNLQ